MTLIEIETYCLAKPGAYLDWPFGPEFAVVKLKAPTQKKGRKDPDHSDNPPGARVEICKAWAARG